MFSGIYFGGYKSFSVSNENPLCDLKHVNVIIGRNNSGKSSVLDVVGCAHDAMLYAVSKSRLSMIEVDVLIEEHNTQQAFSGYSSIGGFRSPKAFTDKYEGTPLRLTLGFEKSSYSEKYSWKYACSTNQSNEDFLSVSSNQLFTRIAQAVTPNDATFRRLSAERNIFPEEESEAESLDMYGNGASNVIRKFINHSGYDESFIEKKLLDALNVIMYLEAKFQSIRVQQIEKDKELLWEVFLQEEGCDRFALSQSGSGLKTIILLILNLLVIPQTKEYKDKKITYGFEELENNLHPSMQRRVFDYIYNYAVGNNICIFLTTHSHVAINAFFDKEDAAIYHVVKENNTSVIKKIDNYIDKIEILDDLDVKASDLLQSNGIIWVEGPSDRIYIKRWLEVFCECRFEEGMHYQFMYYGGRILSHYSAEETEGLINILTTNRNAAIIMDSDKKNRATSLNETKKRIILEFEKYSMFSWHTKGKEIENYISVEAINEALGCALQRQCMQYESFPEYIKNKFKRFSSQKVKFANEVKDFITADNSKSILDLEKQVKQLYAQIEIWNK